MPRATWQDATFGTGILPGQPVGLKAPGTIDLATRPIVHNPDGSISTVASMSIGTDDGEVLIPTIGQRGEVMNPQQAIEEYDRTGYHLGIFENELSANDYARRLHESQANEYVPEQSPSFIDTMSAALHMNNSATNVVDAFNRDPRPSARADYNPFVDPADLEGYEEYADRFIRSRSPEETGQIKQRIDFELQNMKVIARAGGWGKAAAISSATIMDPITLVSMMIPVAGPEAWAAQATRMERVLTGVGSQVALDSSYEAVMHNNQELRTIQDSLFNVGAGAFLTAGFGVLATRVPKAEFEKLRERAAADLERLDLEVKPPSSSTVGAAQVGHNTTIEDEGIAKGGATIAATLGKLVSPLTRVLQSPVKSARVLVQRLADVPFLLGKNLKGIQTPLGAESVIKVRVRKAYANVVLDLANTYQDYVRGKPANLLSFDDFKKAVASSMRSGDSHAIAQVQDVSRRFRKIFDADRAELQALGVLPEDLHIVGAKSYFPRVYNHFAIRKNQQQLAQVLRDWFRSNPVPTKVLRAAAAEGKTAEEIVLRPRDALEIEDVIQQTMDHILGSTRGLSDLGGGRARPLIARSLDVPDELLEPFLVSDVEHVMNSYIHTIAPQIEMRKLFGDVDLRHELQQVTDEYHALLANTNSASMAATLRDNLEKDIANLTGIRDRIMGKTRGNLGANEQLVRAGRILRGWNFVRSLGSMMLSSFSDYGHVMTRYGLRRTLDHTLRFIGSSALRKLSRQDANRIGAAMDLWHDTRAATLGEIGEEVPTGGRIDVGVHRMSAAFSKYSGMSAWNTMIKFLSMTLEQDAVLRAIKKGDSMPKFAKAKLLMHGIGEEELAQMRKEIAHWSGEGGIWRARTELWKNQKMAKLLESAMIRAGDIMTITRGVGDTPFAMNSDLAKLLFQFKSFGITSVNRIMIPVAQGFAHGDVATITGASMMLSLGAMSYAAKEYASGREPNLAPDRLAMEAMNWSGLLGYIPDLYDPLIGGAFNVPRFSRFSDQQPVETLLGPSVGLLSDVYNVYKNDDNEWGVTNKDVHALRKILPFQNMFYLRRIIDGLEGETAENVFGAPDSGNKSFVDRVTGTAAPAKTEAPDLVSAGTALGLAAIGIALGVRSARTVKDLPRLARGEIEVHARAAGEAASDVMMAEHYNPVISHILDILDKQPRGLAKVSANEMVAALDIVVSSNSPYRVLVDKLKEVDLPGDVYFGKNAHLDKATGQKNLGHKGAWFPSHNNNPLMPGAQNIFVNLDTNSVDELGATLMHELTHAATVNKMRALVSAGWRSGDKTIETIRTAASHMQNSGAVPFNHYAFTNTLEFVAEAFGNLEFQQVMKKSGVWPDFVAAIGKVFGISAAGLVALDTVISLPEDGPLTSPTTT